MQESASVIVNNVTSARLTSQAEQDEESALNVIVKFLILFVLFNQL